MGSTWGCGSSSRETVATPLPGVVELSAQATPQPDETCPAFTFECINRPPESPPLEGTTGEPPESPLGTQPRLNVTASNGELAILEGSIDNLVASPRHTIISTGGGCGGRSECRSEESSSSISLPRFHQAASAKRPQWLIHSSATGTPLVGLKGNEVNASVGPFSTPKSSDLKHPSTTIGVPPSSIRRRSSFFNGSTVAWQTRSREGTIADSNVTEHLVPPSATFGSTPGSPNINELMASWGGFYSRHTEATSRGCFGGNESQAGLMSCGTASLVSAVDHGDMLGIIGTSMGSDASVGDRASAPEGGASPAPQMRLPKFAAAT